jgi:hypothetical protein
MNAHLHSGDTVAALLQNIQQSAVLKHGDSLSFRARLQIVVKGIKYMLKAERKECYTDWKNKE